MNVLIVALIKQDNMFEVVKIQCAFCMRWNRHILRHKVQDIVTRCRNCNEIDLIVDEIFVKEHLQRCKLW